MNPHVEIEVSEMCDPYKKGDKFPSMFSLPFSNLRLSRTSEDNALNPNALYFKLLQMKYIYYTYTYSHNMIVCNTEQYS